MYDAKESFRTILGDVIPRRLSKLSGLELEAVFVVVKEGQSASPPCSSRNLIRRLQIFRGAEFLFQPRDHHVYWENSTRRSVSFEEVPEKTITMLLERLRLIGLGTGQPG
jgi:hypothetical protein